MLDLVGGWLFGLLLQGLYELGFRSVAQLRPMEHLRRKPRHWAAIVWWAIFGAAAGDISVFILPTRLTTGAWSIAVALLVPLLAGLAAFLLSGWHRSRFVCGYVFALAFILLRYWLTTQG
jgi:hypothetical protein